MYSALAPCCLHSSNCRSRSLLPFSSLILIFPFVSSSSLSSIFDQCRQFELRWVNFVTIKWTQGPSHRATRDIPCQLPTEENCRCDVSFARPLITSRPVSRSTHRAKENSDGKSLKSSASLADVMKPETPEA